MGLDRQTEAEEASSTRKKETNQLTSFNGGRLYISSLVLPKTLYILHTVDAQQPSPSVRPGGANRPAAA